MKNVKGLTTCAIIVTLGMWGASNLSNAATISGGGYYDYGLIATTLGDSYSLTSDATG